MALIRLDDLFHDCALPQKVCQASHVEWVQQIDFEEKLVADVITVEGNTLDETDVPDEGWFSLVHIAAVADCKGMVDG